MFALHYLTGKLCQKIMVENFCTADVGPVLLFLTLDTTKNKTGKLVTLLESSVSLSEQKRSCLCLEHLMPICTKTPLILTNFSKTCFLREHPL